MAIQQIANPEGAFGESSNRLPVETRTLRNISTAFSIPVGCVVVYSTLTTDGTGVTKSTVINNVLTAGVALTSATTARAGGAEASSIAPAGSWLEVAVSGPAPVIVTTASSPGEIVGTGNSTAFAGTTAGVAATVTTGGAPGLKATLGRLLKASSDTNTTGQLGVVDVDINRQIVNATST